MDNINPKYPEAFLKRIEESPFDYETRKVYQDWLLENGYKQEASVQKGIADKEQLPITLLALTDELQTYEKGRKTAQLVSAFLFIGATGFLFTFLSYLMDRDNKVPLHLYFCCGFFLILNLISALYLSKTNFP